LFFNNGDASLGSPVILSGMVSAEGIAAADLDGDGALDLAVTSVFNDSIAVFPNDGSGNFDAPHEHPAGRWPQSIQCADLDRDGITDVVVSSGMAATVLTGHGNGTFADARSYAADFGSPQTQGLSLADLDGDGDIDIIVACNQVVAVLKNWLLP
jgi:hypothetical protein